MKGAKLLSRIAVSLLALSIATAGQAQEQGEVMALPGATTAPRATLDGPGGVPLYGPQLPKDTPDNAVRADPMLPVGSLTAALHNAYWTNPALLAQRARLRSTDYRLPQARALSGPSINYEAAYGYQRNNTELLADNWVARSGWSSTAAAVLTQPIFTYGRIASAENGALGQIAFQRATLRSTEANTYYTVIAAYAGLMRDRLSLGIYRDDLALLEREYRDNDARFSKREVTISDLQQVETRVEQARAQVLLAQSTLANSEAQFLSAIGAPARGDLATPDPLPVPVRSLEEAYAYAELHSPVLAAAYARERVSRATASGLRAALAPRVDLRGRAEINGVTPYSDRLRQTELRGEVVLSGSLWSAGQNYAQLSEAELANDADRRLLDQTLRENRVEVASAWNQWLAQTAAVAQLELSVVAARKALDGALEQEKAGLRTTLDVLSLARELLIARSSHNNALTNSYLAKASMLAQIGALEQAWLFPDAERYDPEDHLRRVKGDGQIPLLQPLIRAIDGVIVGGGKDRAIRDPSGPLVTRGVTLPVPTPETTPRPPGTP